MARIDNKDVDEQKTPCTNRQNIKFWSCHPKTDHELCGHGIYKRCRRSKIWMVCPLRHPPKREAACGKYPGSRSLSADFASRWTLHGAPQSLVYHWLYRYSVIKHSYDHANVIFLTRNGQESTEWQNKFVPILIGKWVSILSSPSLAFQFFLDWLHRYSCAFWTAIWWTCLLLLCF